MFFEFKRQQLSMNKISPCGVLPKNIVVDLLDKYLVTDNEFWEDAVVCMNIQQSEKLKEKAERLWYLKTNCLYNQSRGYTLQMLVFKHVFRLLKESCGYYIDEFNFDLIKKGGLI